MSQHIDNTVYAQCLFETVARDLKESLGDRAIQLAEQAAAHACATRDDEAAAMWHAVYQALMNIAPLLHPTPNSIH